MQDLASQDRSTTQWIRHWATHTPDAVALMYLGHAATYRQLAILVVQLTGALRDAGVERGRIVGVVSGNAYIHVAQVLACHALGATTLSLPDSSMTEEPATCAKCDVLLVEAAHHRPGTHPGTHPGAVAITEAFLRRVAAAPVTGLEALDTRAADDDIMVIARTSGTTGTPKLMTLSAAVWRRRCRHRSRYILDPGAAADFIATTNPDILTYLHRTMVYLNLGRTTRYPSFQYIPEAVARSEAAHVVISPVAAQAMLDAFDASRWVRKAKRIDLVGADASPRLRENLLRIATESVYEAYGSNETLTAAYGHGETVKTIFPDVRIRIRDEAGTLLPLGETGTIEVGSALLASGYLDDPDLTARVFQDGWHRTSDLGYMPAADKLVVIGRNDDILNIAGTKVSPHPIEDQIRSVPGIADAAIINVPDARGLDTLHACIEKPGGRLTGQDIQHIRDVLERNAFLYIYRIWPTDAFPRTGSGKVRRNELRRRIAAEG